MKEIRVKNIFSYDYENLQTAINSFLEEMESSEIKDIKFCMSEDAKDIHYSAMIIYEIEK